MDFFTRESSNQMITRDMTTRVRTFIASAFIFLLGALGLLAQEAAPDKATARYTKWWLPDEATEVAGKIDHLFYVILWITGVVFVLVFITMIYFLIRYRRRDGRKAVYYHGNTRLEIIWTVIPALIVIALGIISRDLWAEIKSEMPSGDNALIVDVQPRQFEWKITYPGADGKFSKAGDTLPSDDIVTVNQLHVPANRDVLVMLTAQDVIHSFFVPEFRVKQDAVPGMVTRTWFNVPKPGSFEIACAELCGLGHYRMRGYVTVHSQADFEKWYREQMDKKAAELAPPPPAPADTSASASAPADTSAAPAAADTSAASGTDTSASASQSSDTSGAGR